MKYRFTKVLREFFANFKIASEKIVICTASYESHTFFHEFALVNQANK
jgi:hypothetical protein